MTAFVGLYRYACRVVLPAAAVLLSAGLPARAETSPPDVIAAEELRYARFASLWSGFLLRSLDASDEQQRLVAAHLVLAGALNGRTPYRVATLAQLTRAADARDAVRLRTRDPVTLAIAAAHCRPQLHDDCDRVALRERAVQADPDNAWLWLQLGGEVGRQNPIRAQQAFARAVNAPAMRELPWSETIAATHVPLRRDYPQADADLALVQTMGLAAAGIDAALGFLSAECSPQVAARDPRAAECRRLVEAVGNEARTLLTLSIALRLGTQLALPSEVLSAWKLRSEAARDGQRRQPLLPVAAYRDQMIGYGDDLVAVGELEAARRLQRLPTMMAGVPVSEFERLVANQTAARDEIERRVGALLGDDSAMAALLTRDWAPWERFEPSRGSRQLTAERRQALRDEVARSIDPALLTLAALRCAEASTGCSARAAAERWSEVEPDNAAAWLQLAKVQLDAGEAGGARAAVLRAAVLPRYAGHGLARLRSAYARLRAVEPMQAPASSFALAHALASPRLAFGRSVLDRLCTADADADLRAACRTIAQRIDADATSVADRELAIDVLRKLDQRVDRAKALQLAHVAQAGAALGLSEFGWRTPLAAGGRPDAAAAQTVIDALLARGELGAIESLYAENGEFRQARAEPQTQGESRGGNPPLHRP
jgi:hypothetical protein